MSDEYRIEEDSLGEVEVPKDALYGAQTQRAIDNFPISNITFNRRFIRAIGLVKLSAAETNLELGLLDDDIAETIMEASKEVINGRHDDEFPVDIFQTGSGTSTNMNANEVIANRASEILGEGRESKAVHPNDDVNKCQSSNDVIPTSIHVASLMSIEEDLLPSLEKLKSELNSKAEEFDTIVKTGRTHLQDATPIRLGQEFSGYASQVSKGISRIKKSEDSLSELAIGGTAVGTGMNAHTDFPEIMVKKLSQKTGIEFREAENHFEAQAGRDAIVEASGSLNTIASSFMKIANDLRWMSSGPRTGLGEIDLPAVQPGSSIMPGKVNPVICESVCQVAVQVTGNNTAISIGGQAGNFELNVMKPVMAHNLLQSIELLANSSETLAELCISGIEANEQVCEKYAEESLSIVTALAPHIGYDKAADIAKNALKEDKTIKEIALERDVMDEEKLDEVLDPEKMTKIGIL